MIRRPFLTPLLLFVVFICSSLSAPLARAAAAGENQFDVSVTLFSTMAAINAAGFDAEINSQANYPIRNQIREELSKRNIPSLNELKAFYQQHRKGTDTATLSQYISFALLAQGPPDFKLEDGELPPDVKELYGFNELLTRFYREANLDDLWRRSQPAFAAAVQRYQEPVINAVLEANGYLRNPTNGDTARRFQIYMSLLASPNQVQVRNYKGNYYVVLTPSREPLVNEVRSAYLSYLLDPLSLRFSKTIDTKKDLQRFSEQAPALEEVYKNDYSLLVTKCLIKAIESRLMHDSTKRQAYVDESVKEGFILTAAFAELLPLYEKQPAAMRLYYPDLINEIDVDKERKRLKNVEFVQSIPQKVVETPVAERQQGEAQRTLESAESMYEQHDYSSAKTLFQKALQQTENTSMHAEAYYGLARVAVQQHNGDQAASFFQKVVDLKPDAQILAWSHVYLGRIAMIHDDTQTATNHFKTALSIDGASSKAKEAAQSDLQKLSGDQQQ